MIGIPKLNLEIYRFFQVEIIKKFILPIWARRSYQINLTQSLYSKRSGRRPIWFHAASVGELESLWPLILVAAQEGYPLILTILSSSAFHVLSQLKSSLKEQKAEIIYAGYAPWEGEWKKAISEWNPLLFLTAKYEAWPDLWVSLSEASVPLVIVSASARRSLKIAKWICEKLFGKLPQLFLFTCTHDEVLPLETLFPNAVIHVAGETRWDRVFARNKIGKPRAKALVQILKNAKRPWGILGSAWIEDLNFIKETAQTFEGTLWIVPHKVDLVNIGRMVDLLSSLGFEPLLTSKIDLAQGLPSLEKNACIIVNEMGFLSELYSNSDWAFVGGGFGAGVHSTIEPAIQGIPIAVGPNGTEKFAEVKVLQDCGQLQILRNKSDFAVWLNSIENLTEKEKTHWKSTAERHIGATQRIWGHLEKIF